MKFGGYLHNASRLTDPVNAGAIILYAVDLAVLLYNFYARKISFYGKSKPLMMITKGLLIPLLAILIYNNRRLQNEKFELFALGCWIGDIMLMFNGFALQLLGVICFGAAHVGLILFYDVPIKMPDVITLMLVVVPCLALVFYTFPIAFKAKAEYRAVILYILVLGSSMAAAGMRSMKYGLMSFTYHLVYAGHLMFILSDSILIAAILRHSPPDFNFNVLLTYGLALLFIFAGNLVA